MRKEINIHNYEAYFLDYHEGSLTPVLVKELMEFIEKHPELKEELESFQPISLNDTEIRYEEKEGLKKQLTGINPSNFDEYAIEYVEGTLPVVLKNELKIFISQNPTYKKELELYTKTKLVADTSIVFDDKLSLKRKTRRPAAFYYWSAAASVALIIGAYFIVNKNKTPDGNIVIKHNQIPDSNVAANYITKSVDAGSIAPKIVPNKSSNNVVKNIPIIAKIKLRRTKSLMSINSQNNSTVTALNGGMNTVKMLTFETVRFIPNDIENSSSGLTGNLRDTAVIKDWIKKYGNPKNSVEMAEESNSERKGNKILYLIAKLTCKGLHKVTGQRFEMEKRYDSDTTNVIAYQLDLGKARFNFPVKE